MRNINMFMNNSIEKLTIKKEYHENAILAWKNVKSCYKKNGEEFQNKNKWFIHAHFIKSDFSLIHESKLTVSFKVRCGYESDSIVDTELIKYSDMAKNVDPERIIKESCIEPYFHLTMKELQKRIQERIKYHECMLLECHNALNEFNSKLELIKENLDNIESIVNNCNSVLKSVINYEILHKVF